MIKAELKKTIIGQNGNDPITEDVITIKEDDKVYMTINLEKNPQVFNLISLLDQSKVIDLEVIDPIEEKSKLKQVRELKGLTLDELGKMVGVSRQSIAKIENGESEPRLSLAIKIADALNMDVRDII